MDGTDYGNPIASVRCRLMATTNMVTIQEESGVSGWETIQIFNSAVQDTAGQVGGVLSAALPWVPLLLVAFLAYQLMEGKGHRGR